MIVAKHEVTTGKKESGTIGYYLIQLQPIKYIKINHKNTLIC